MNTLPALSSPQSMPPAQGPVVAFELFNNIASGNFHVGFIKSADFAEASSHPKVRELYRPCLSAWTQNQLDSYATHNGAPRFL